MTQALLGRSAAELQDWAVAQGQKPFRGRQLHDWIYAKGLDPWPTSRSSPRPGVPPCWRTGIDVGRLKEVHRSVATDATTKLLLSTEDGETIETVGIPTDQRLTVCVSSQVGCPMACRFCATGKGGLQRSLRTHEIVDQVLSVREAMDRRPSHIVFMGMGEPLLNSAAVLDAIRCLNDDLGIGQRRITVSTVGVPKTLPQLAELAMHPGPRPVHPGGEPACPEPALREELIPTAHAYPFEALLEDCRHYLDVTGRRVSFEYILLGELNDKPEHAESWRIGSAVSRAT